MKYHIRAIIRFQCVNYGDNHCWRCKTKLSIYRPRQAPRVLGDWSSLQTLGTWRCQGCQPYAPVDFTPQEVFLVLISVKGWVDSSAAGRNKSMKSSNGSIRNWTRHLPACRAAPLHVPLKMYICNNYFTISAISRYCRIHGSDPTMQ